MQTRSFVFAGLFGLSITIAGWTSVFADASEVRDTLRAASRDIARGIDADDSADFQKLLTLLPKDDIDGTYLVEGDIPVTPKELEEHLLGYAVGSVTAVSNPELKINLHLGDRDFYADPADRTLTYSVSRASFGDDVSRYDDAVTFMAEATSDWDAICPPCGIDFQHEAQHDGVSSNGATNFVLEFRDSAGAFIAKAFFPHHTGNRRKVIIDPSFFTTSFDKRGVLRHELGHVLGYRHEHIDGIPGCFSEQDNWLPLTDYDPQSVMHYFCGGGGSFDLAISDTDIEGHRALYGTGGE